MACPQYNRTWYDEHGSAKTALSHPGLGWGRAVLWLRNWTGTKGLCSIIQPFCRLCVWSWVAQYLHPSDPEIWKGSHYTSFLPSFGFLMCVDSLLLHASYRTEYMIWSSHNTSVISLSVNEAIYYNWSLCFTRRLTTHRAKSGLLTMFL